MTARFDDTQVRVVQAHAKVNLVLHILTREASGYHSIETLFQKLALHDVVTVRVDASDRTLKCEGVMIPEGGLGPVQQNLAWRAAELFAQTARWESGWQITIDKRIPVGGGLGGGSADAAAVLRGLNAMAPAPLSEAMLLELGGTLGADVPFLLSGASLTWAWGRGDRLLTLPALPVAGVELYTFATGMNTGAAYAEVARIRAADGGNARHARRYEPRDFSSWARVRAIAANDFEPVVATMHDGVAALLPSLRQQAHDTGRGAIGMMSGSGATCFLLDSNGGRQASQHDDSGPGPNGVSGVLLQRSGVRVIHTTTA